MATVTQDLKAIAHRFWEEANQRNWAAFDEFVAENYAGHGLDTAQGREGLKAEIMSYVAAFPDLRYTVDDVISEGDQVMSRWTARGTHTGQLMDIPPTGKPVTINGISVDRVVNGKMVEGWTEFDMLGMFQQLGVLPSLE